MAALLVMAKPALSLAGKRWSSLTASQMSTFTSATRVSAGFESSYVSIHGGSTDRLDLTGSSGSQAAQAAMLASSLGTQDVVRDVSDQSGVDVYRHCGNISLYSSMQSTVPLPYCHDNRGPSHVNMPRGGLARRLKYSADRQCSASEPDPTDTSDEAVSRKY